MLAKALHHHWQLTGLGLVLTPFLVLRPFVRDAWIVALHRSLGTLAGVLLVMGLALLLPSGLPLQLPATAGGVITITIVLFNSTHADLIQMADERLQASAMGVALALGVMAIAHPIERSLAIRRVRTN